MTTVVFELASDGSYRGFTCMGHAGYARKGSPDILCSAISALTIHTANGIQFAAGDEIEVSQNEETGFFRCQIRSGPKEGTRILMDSLLQSMKGLSEQYGEKYLQVTIRKETKDA
ncbi:MAG: ribosomal-processing cysteine protease Prp [Lachnospiraceae bacterium]|nr:ribosomal-processing cysteine protease Prp [Lachnospiraceae bacterium]MCR5477927.1 ribosomal-processing cysteine protease Prp [Lachnospiraceae bacterium]